MIPDIGTTQLTGGVFMNNAFTASSHESTVETLRPGDPGFVIHNGFMMAQRAGFEIIIKCPQAWSNVILQAISKGYLKPIATVKKSELIWDRLGA